MGPRLATPVSSTAAQARVQPSGCGRRSRALVLPQSRSALEPVGRVARAVTAPGPTAAPQALDPQHSGDTSPHCPKNWQVFIVHTGNELTRAYLQWRPHREHQSPTRASPGRCPRHPAPGSTGRSGPCPGGPGSPRSGASRETAPGSRLQGRRVSGWQGRPGGREPGPTTRLTFPGHLHRHAAGRRPQVHSGPARADGQARLPRVPLEGAHGAQLLQHHEQPQLLHVPHPHGVGRVVWRSNHGAVPTPYAHGAGPTGCSPQPSPGQLRFPH